MNIKQIIAIFIPPILIGAMYLIFRFLSGLVGERMGWYFGLVIYWIIWGGLFSVKIIGRDNILALIHPKEFNTKVFLLVLFPLLMASLYKLIPGMGYQKKNIWVFLLLVSTTFGNGFFEEIFWRGVYMELFPNNIFFRIIWPSLWFGIWHYVPGSTVSGGNVLGLVIGSSFLGFYSSFLAANTETIFWSIIAHTLGGIIMIL